MLKRKKSPIRSDDKATPFHFVPKKDQILIVNRKYEDSNEDIDPELSDHLLWLQNNKQPWSKASSLWELTSKHRMRSLISGTVQVATYLTKYPGLQDPSGYLLLATDF
ncbi:hypothetical protein ONE63_001056 [Megalurothrips usitatus]|uniref:Uncharacterized protein n=1 Tax=Megalurothrips usitatus TaxID=439358 RepID=A0AAV7XEY1_9NEOP|nr:hypothetical protein ONE63_001056 [Megalurothrips usitatus]